MSFDTAGIETGGYDPLFAIPAGQLIREDDVCLAQNVTLQHQNKTPKSVTNLLCAYNCDEPSFFRFGTSFIASSLIVSANICVREEILTMRAFLSGDDCEEKWQKTLCKNVVPDDVRSKLKIEAVSGELFDWRHHDSAVWIMKTEHLHF